MLEKVREEPPKRKLLTKSQKDEARMVASRMKVEKLSSRSTLRLGIKRCMGGGGGGGGFF